MCLHGQHRPAFEETHFVHQVGASVQAGFLSVTEKTPGMESLESVQPQRGCWSLVHLDPNPSFTLDYEPISLNLSGA